MNEIPGSLRPLYRRPDTGLLAWQATLGYIRVRHSPDATLELQADAGPEGQVRWAAAVSWGSVAESIDGQSSLGQALDTLWQKVNSQHTIFQNPDDAIRSPSDYDDFSWLDMNTQEILHRIMWTSQTVFPGNWLLLILYRPTEDPQTRVQMRLLVNSGQVSIGGRGPAVLDAARSLFRKAAPVYAAHSGMENMPPGES